VICPEVNRSQQRLKQNAYQLSKRRMISSSLGRTRGRARPISLYTCLPALQPLSRSQESTDACSIKPRQRYLSTLSSDLPQTQPASASHAFQAVAFRLVVVFVAAAAAVVVAAIDGHTWPGELKRALPRPGLRAALLLRSPDAIHQHDRLAHRSRRAGGGSSVVQPVLLNTNDPTISFQTSDKIPYRPEG
jgi:hypothetical protein